MKKYYVGLAFLGLLLGYTAKMGYWFQDERDVFFPITKEQLRAKKQLQKNQMQHDDGEKASAENNLAKTANEPTAASTSTPVNLDKLSQSELFNQIYNQKVLNEKQNHGTYFQMIRTRLNSAYPPVVDTKYRSGYEHEVADRIGLLRAMAKFWNTPKQLSGVDSKSVKLLFYNLAQNKNENLMVRRQAFKNWLYFGDSVSQVEKRKLASAADTRLLHLVALSDEDLIESLTTGDE